VPIATQKMLDYGLLKVYYSGPAQLPVAGRLFKEAIELLRWYLQGLIATHGHGV
jgi:hypothetical protein